MSRFPLYDLARDATLAVGAYVGVLREHVKTEWATVLGGSFDERVAQARARMEAQADALADKEAEEEVSDSWCNGCDQYTSVCGGPHPCVHCSSAPGVVAASGSDSSPAAAQRAGEKPGRVEDVPPASSPSGQSLTPDDLVVGDPLACAIRDATQDNPNGMQVVCFVTDKYWEDRRVFTMTGWQWDDDILCTNWVEPAKDLQRLLDWPTHDAQQ